jgi:hypothetical protein
MNKKTIGFIILGLAMLGITGYLLYQKFGKKSTALVETIRSTVAGDEEAYDDMKNYFIGNLVDGEAIWSWLVEYVDKRMKGEGQFKLKQQDMINGQVTKTAALFSAMSSHVLAWVPGGSMYGKPNEPKYELKNGMKYDQFAGTLWNKWIAFKNTNNYAAY